MMPWAKKSGLPDHEVISLSLQDFVSSYKKLKTGRFVLLRLYRTDLTMITEIIDEDYSSIKTVKTLADTFENHVPRNKDDLYDIIRVDGIPHVKILTPLFNTTGDVVAFIKGVFALSSKTIGGIRGRAVRTMLIAIADVFDALTSHRPYKEAFSFDKAMSILEESRGSHFDPELLDTFAGIARPLYDQLANRDNEPRDELETIIKQYFTKNIDSLDY